MAWAVSTRQHCQLRRAVTVAMRMQRCGVTLRQLRHDPAAAHEVAYLGLGPPSANGGSARMSQCERLKRREHALLYFS